jgi:hypothetical protein
MSTRVLYLAPPLLAAALYCGTRASAPPVQVRFVVDGKTHRSDLHGEPAKVVVAESYPGLTRTTRENPWDLFDPMTGKYLVAFRAADGKHGLYAIAGATATPELVQFDSIPSTLTEAPPTWGVLSSDGALLYLSGDGGAYVAHRKGKGLAFGALNPTGFGAQIIHDVSADRKLAIASGTRAIKWDNPFDVVAPRQMSLYTLKADGTFAEDVTAKHPPLAEYMQSPVFLPDSQGLLYEGDDDIDTGDRLFLYRFGSAPTELAPAAVRDRDFNTPCMTRDGRVAFWESGRKQYLLRLYNPADNSTVTVHDAWLPFSGYVRCR